MGGFRKVNGVKEDGMPVYVNSANQYLAYMARWGITGAWVITSDYEGSNGNVYAVSSYECPDTNGLVWLYNEASLWKTSDITVVETGMIIETINMYRKNIITARSSVFGYIYFEIDAISFHFNLFLIRLKQILRRKQV